MKQEALQDGGMMDSGPEAVTVDKLSSFDQVESIRGEWNELHDALVPGSIHADIDWYCMIAKSFASNNSPVVFTFRRKTVLVGIIAGYYHERKVPLKFGYLQLGHFKTPALSTNYQCCIGRADQYLHQKMADVLWAELSSGNVRLIYVNALPTNDPLYQTLARTRLSDGICLAYPPARHMMMRLAKTLQETIEVKGPRVRAFLRRIINKNSRPDAAPVFTLRLFTRPEELERYFADAEAVAQKTYQRALNVGFQPTSFHRTQAEIAAKKGCFRGNILYNKDNPVAFQEDYLRGTHCFNPYVGYDPAYRSHNPGTLLMVKAWEELIKSTKATVYDFGYGEGMYKERFADICICEGELLLFAMTFGNLFFYVLLSVDLWIEKNLKRLLNTLGIYEAIKKFWRRQKTPATPSNIHPARPREADSTTE